RHGHADPFLARAIAVAESRTHWQQRRLALGSGHDAGTVAIGDPGVGRVLEDASDTRHVPARLAGGSENAGLGEAQSETVYSRTWLKIPGEHLLDDGGRGGSEVQAGRIAWMLGIEPVAKGRATPGQQLACPQVSEATATHAVADQRALILGPRGDCP